MDAVGDALALLLLLLLSPISNGCAGGDVLDVAAVDTGEFVALLLPLLPPGTASNGEIVELDGGDNTGPAAAGEESFVGEDGESPRITCAFLPRPPANTVDAPVAPLAADGDVDVDVEDAVDADEPLVVDDADDEDDALLDPVEPARDRPGADVTRAFFALLSLLLLLLLDSVLAAAAVFAFDVVADNGPLPRLPVSRALVLPDDDLGCCCFVAVVVDALPIQPPALVFAGVLLAGEDRDPDDDGDVSLALLGDKRSLPVGDDWGGGEPVGRLSPSTTAAQQQHQTYRLNE